MRSTHLSFFALVTLAACTTKQARRPDTAAPATATLAGAPTPDVAAVKQAVEALDAKQAADVMKGDAAAAAAYYADDAIVMIPGDKIAIGHEAVLKAMTNFLSNVKVTAFTPHSQDLLVTGEYAIETLAYEMTLQPKTGKPIQDKGKGLTVFKKQPDGSYKAIRDIFNSDLPPMK